MHLFDVYPLFNITPVRAEGCYVWDERGTRYLDFYGGHAVISIGHSHPHYIKMLRQQVEKIGFYSNSIRNPLQDELAVKLGDLSGYSDYQLFLCNSGAEAIENALKLASFHTGRKKVVMFDKAFHGRTSAAVAITDNPKIVAPLNSGHEVIKLPLNDYEALSDVVKKEDICAVVVEGIQGIGGIYLPDHDFLKHARELCSAHGTVLVLDEIQSGYGRSGKFFAHQYAGIQPDLITVAKGMGNGFPIGGVIISPEIRPWHGMLGTTFGGSHLACAAGIAVLDVIKSESLTEKAATAGAYLINRLNEMPGVREVRGVGLMIGVELYGPTGPLRQYMLNEHQVFTGSASNPNIIRLLPPLCVQPEHADALVKAFDLALKVMAP
ncbi:MAG: aminotransferase class III-fold pyridoxal phosphate-dependent enzyme [Bacteroidia bacterium]